MFRFIALLAIPFIAVSAKEPAQVPDASAKFIGSVGCKSSSCHGGAGEKRSQYITWSQKDFHTRAYAILLDARSARIGEAVGIALPQSSARCTICHSPFQSLSQSRLAPTARPDEGVSCESCHGAAEPWLRGHTRPDWSYATRVSAGLHDLRNLYVRANACVACHQNVDADILKAGHPDLVFEMDSQSVNEPKHWREDDPSAGLRSWLIGQAVALREMSWQLGRIPPTDRNLLFDQQSALIWLLDKTVPLISLARAQPRLAEFSSFVGASGRADEIAHDAQNWKPSPDSMMSILQTLAGSDSEFRSNSGSRDNQFYRALRLTLAIERLSFALGIPEKINKELNALREDVHRRYDFDSASFAEHLSVLRQKL